MKIVQIGSNRGNDDLSRELKKAFSNLEFALFVEPNSLHIEDLKTCYSCYSNAIIENIAIGFIPNQDDMTIFYHVDDGPGYEVASCKYEHVRYHYPTGEIKSFNISCITLEELLDKHHIIDLDWLLLDVEGIDAELVLSFNWQKYNIKRIDVESIHLDRYGKYRDKIHKMFLDMGYKNIPALHEYDWAFEK